MAAKQSRDNKTAYMRELEEHLQATRDRCTYLEQELRLTAQSMEALHAEISTLKEIIATHSEPVDEAMFFMD